MITSATGQEMIVSLGEVILIGACLALLCGALAAWVRWIRRKPPGWRETSGRDAAVTEVPRLRRTMADGGSPRRDLTQEEIWLEWERDFLSLRERRPHEASTDGTDREGRATCRPKSEMQ